MKVDTKEVKKGQVYTRLDDPSHPSHGPTVHSTFHRARSAAGIGHSFAQHTWRNLRRSKLNFCVGCVAVLLVVVVVSVLLTVLSNTPLVFLRLSELQAGEVDLEIAAQDSTQKLNYTKIAEILKQESEKAVSASDHKFWESEGDGYTYSSPRYTGPSVLYAARDCTGPLDGLNCANGKDRRGYLHLIDSSREKRMGLGRDWTIPNIGKGQVVLAEAVALDLGVGVGDEVLMGFDLGDLLGVAGWEAIFGPSRFDPNVYFKLKIQDVFSNPHGKNPTRFSRSLYMEFSEFLPYFSEQQIEIVTPSRRSRLMTVNLEEYAEYVLVNLPPPSRLQFYIESNFDTVQESVTTFASLVSYAVGFTLTKQDLPVLDYYSRFSILNLFLELIINVVIFILLFICIVLIYSLLITNVETRTFEIGILRMVGSTRVEVIFLLLCQAISYSTLSYPLGLAIGQALCVYIFANIEVLIGVHIDPYLTSSSILTSGFMGLIIPVVSSVAPIRSALGKNLLDSLDTRGSKVKAVQYSMDRSEDSKISWSLLLTGLLMVIFGVSIYYLMPYALVSFNLSLLLNIFVFLLVGLLLGMTMLSINFQHMLERFLVMTLLFWERSAICSIVKKNLVAHRLRNRKTTILYAVSLAFIVFIQVSYSLQLSTFLYQRQQENGCYLKVTASGYDTFSQVAFSIGTVHDLERYAEAQSLVKDFGWISLDLASAIPSFSSITASNVGQMKSNRFKIFGVSPQIFDVAIQGFLKVHKFESVEGFPLVESLYTKRGSHSLVIGSLFEEELGIVDLQTHYLLKFSINLDTFQQIGTGSYLNKRYTSTAMLDSAPAFTFSEYPGVTNQDALVSFSTFVRLSNGTISSVDDIPMRDFIIQLKDGITDKEIDTLKRGLDYVSGGQYGVSTWDYRDDLEPIEKATEILGYFFNFTTAVALIVCWFSLNSSMFANVYEQTKEISILRAIGVTKFWMYRIYIYEALILVLSSSFLGIIIGSAVGYTMTIQRALYTQLPIPFVFPTGIIEVVGASSIVFAILASFGPINFLLRMPVVAIMRYVN